MRCVLIRGGGIAGQVLRRELEEKHVPVFLKESLAFPRDKVCGCVLQAGTWDYLEKTFSPAVSVRRFSSMSHYWRGRLISRSKSPRPMVFARRLELDAALAASNGPSKNPPAADPIEVDARGACTPDGEWMGFQVECQPVGELEMHYGRGLYLGIAPTSGGLSHAAILIRKDLLAGDWKSAVQRELGLTFHGPAKATGPIRYGRIAEGLAVGDAKMPTHPFLGLGMKHAVESARLLASLIAAGEFSRYDSEHRRLFWRYSAASALSGFFHGSAAAPAFFGTACRRPFFQAGYRWLHA